MREASLDNSPIDVSWLGRSRTPLPRVQISRDQLDRLPSRPVEIADDLPQPDISVTAVAERLYSDDAPASEGASELMLNIDAIEQRYPLLRNAL
jgi:hypothetical protein